MLGSDLRHAPAYRLLVSVYQRSGDLDRAARVGTMLSLLGYAEATDRPPTFRANVKRGSLSEELRRTRLLPPPVLGAYTEALAAVRETLDEVYGVPAVHDAMPASAVHDPGFKVCVVDAQRLFGVTADVYVAQQVPGGVVHVRLAQADGDHRGGVRRASRRRAALPARARVRAAARRLRAGDAPARGAAGRGRPPARSARSSPRRSASSRCRSSSRRCRERRRRRWSACRGSRRARRSKVGSRARAGGDRAGLLACDDVGAAARMLARLGGEELAVSPDGAVALGQVAGGAELVRFFLSDAYHELRSTLGDPTGRL